MTYAIGRGVRVEVGNTEGSAKTVTAVTSANPPVATSTAHALLAKSVGYFSVATGMPQLEGQAVRFSAVDTNSLTLQDLDATNYGTFTAGTLIPITAWLTVANAVDYSIPEASASPLDTTVLLDDIGQQENGILGAQVATFTIRQQTISDTAMAKIRAAAKTGAYLVFRITLKDGSVRVFRGQPSLPGESLSQGQVGSGSFSVTIKGFVIEGAA